MCLGIPGKLIEIHKQTDPPMGRVEFGGILKEVCLAYTPEAQVGDYVLVHVGFAISRLDEAEAAEMFEFLEEIEDAAEQKEQQPENEVGSPDKSIVDVSLRSK